MSVTNVINFEIRAVLAERNYSSFIRSLIDTNLELKLRPTEAPDTNKTEDETNPLTNRALFSLQLNIASRNFCSAVTLARNCLAAPSFRRAAHVAHRATASYRVSAASFPSR